MGSKIDRWKERARHLKNQVHALFLASRDPRVPWTAKALAVVVVAYAMSPIDLIPDFIPIIGYLDDLVLVPLGIGLVIRMIPSDVWADLQAQAASGQRPSPAARWVAAGFIAVLWAVAFLWIASLFFHKPAG